MLDIVTVDLVLAQVLWIGEPFSGFFQPFFEPFQAAVLNACRRVKHGKTITYGQLAKEIGKSNAARAVGNALARNPLPLIIPCHRVLAANNKLGGFSAPGGKNLKARLLKHEQHAAE